MSFSLENLRITHKFRTEKPNICFPKTFSYFLHIFSQSGVIINDNIVVRICRLNLKPYMFAKIAASLFAFPNLTRRPESRVEHVLKTPDAPLTYKKRRA